MDLELRGVCFGYRNGERLQSALQDISLQIRSHEFVAIVGPSGCGKSTLLNLVGGFITPTEGQILAGANPVSGPGAERMMIFQKSALFPFLTVARNVEYGLKLRGIPQEDRRSRRDDMLASVNLSSFSNMFPKELSEGMRKLVEIARALVLRAPVLLFDESLGNLDALTRYKAQLLIQQLWREHRPTVVWVTHDLEEAVLLADRVVVLSDRPGRITAVKEIPLARPRTELTRTSHELQAIRQGLFETLELNSSRTELI